MAGDELWSAHLRNLGGFIREQRRLAELSQRDLAKLVNLSDTYMSQLERGLHEPSVRVLRSLADGLGVGLEQLMSLVTGAPGEPAADADATPSTEQAIRHDPRLTATQREALLGVLRSFTQPPG